MSKILDSVLDTVDGFLAWLGVSVGQLTECYCKLETAESEFNLVAQDGSLLSIIRIHGSNFLVGETEFARLHEGLAASLRPALSKHGHLVQVFFQRSPEQIEAELTNILVPARQTLERLKLDLDDLLAEKVKFLSKYCAVEDIFLVFWTTPGIFTREQFESALKSKQQKVREWKLPVFRNAQNFLAVIPELLDTHNSFVNLLVEELNSLGLSSELLDVHQACRQIRLSIDPTFTDNSWLPTLPGDKLPQRDGKHITDELSNALWPNLAKQLIPRDAEQLDLRTVRIGDLCFSSIFVELFPKELQDFSRLLKRLQQQRIPWRISFLLKSNGMNSLGLKSLLSTVLSFSSSDNKLINASLTELRNLANNSDEALIGLKVSLSTWAGCNQLDLLRTRTAELAKAVQGWGYMETSELSGDPFAGALSSALAITDESLARTTVAPLAEAVYLLPLARPASPWQQGAVLFRTEDGKPWPYQPGSSRQTTWIDIIYARPGSGKSVLSNSINLALCLSAGISRLPYIAVIDIGPSSSGLISLLKEALPDDQKHLVAYHRLSMSKHMAINPFDTQLGARYPTPQDRAFLVNFITLLATPVGEYKSYDGIADMAGMIVNELYKSLEDSGNPNRYSSNLLPEVDLKLAELRYPFDIKTTWWEVTDALFAAGESHLASLAQRYAMPLLADAVSIARTPAIEDLYGNIKAPTGEPIINAFARMLSGAIREYPLLSRVTSFDLGEARIVSLDLDEVAKTGGEAADRQTAIMYMLARYVVARNFYLTEDSVANFPEQYQAYHIEKVLRSKEDQKRLVFDEFHRTSKSKAVRDQILVDMREGRKWKVQVALISQSLDDFDPTMVEFATSIFIMDAGPKQAIDKSCRVFGLSETAELALTYRVHGPKSTGATFLAQFATKQGMNLNLLTSSIGPIELWAFTTTSEDARVRNALYQRLGAKQARSLLAKLYPSGSIQKELEQRLNSLKTKNSDVITNEKTQNIIDELIKEILTYAQKQAAQTNMIRD